MAIAEDRPLSNGGSHCLLMKSRQWLDPSNGGSHCLLMKSSEANVEDRPLHIASLLFMSSEAMAGG